MNSHDAETAPVSDALFARAERVIPGGVNSPVRAFRGVGGRPFFVASAEGCRITDVDGRTYVDFFTGAGALNYGHNHPQIKKRLIEYLEGDGIMHSLDLYTAAKRDFIATSTGTPAGMTRPRKSIACDASRWASRLIDTKLPSMTLRRVILDDSVTL